MSATSLPKTPLDYVAEGYWQDFLTNRPIAGGIAYEAALHNCQLDKSLLSLQRLDTLILQMRRDMIKANIWHEDKLLADERYRNLLIFLAFYAGQVLAKQWQNMPHWYGQFELRARYPELPLITDDFYRHMAVLYKAAATQNEGIKAEVSDKVAVPLFFALEPIGMRLFGHIDRQFQALQGGQVASGLYQAVSALLPNFTSNKANNNVNTEFSANNSLIDDTLINKSPRASQPIVNTAQQISVASTSSSPVSITKVAPTPILTKNLITVPDNIQPTPIQTQPAPPKPAIQIAPTPEIFTQLLTELDEIELVQTAGNEDYRQARKILDQFERHIAKQHKARAQVMFSHKHQASREQALVLLNKSAMAGNTAAMLRLAMYELLGEGLSINNLEDKAASKEAGVDWVKQAASTKDSRAQRLLSKMYYQGVGVTQDIETGKQWLEQAAKNGHLEAESLVAQWQQAQMLITTREQEEHSFKRYQLLIAAVIVAAVLLIIFV
ncbi:sel1 repeat family protein [Psychrobacter frigidicola]|uniref:Sel1 repeat family protein n=2 Tax=Psychrobacter frigidicola TaxID=45611 RepID=A0A5C7A7E5_9GAMM|nr:sel1 repeat family protein [Psychrobacter frigidicola]